jgi:hypothetical protein
VTDWTIRDALPEDEACLVSMWLKSYAHSHDMQKLGFPSACVDSHPDEIRYWKVFQPIVTALVRSGSVKVACDPSRPTYEKGPAIILAYTCTSPGRVHWVGIKRNLLPIQGGEFALDLVEAMAPGMMADEALRSTFDLMDLRKLTLARRWERDRRWLEALQLASKQILAGERIFAQVFGHMADIHRPEWMPATMRAKLRGAA